MLKLKYDYGQTDLRTKMIIGKASLFNNKYVNFNQRSFQIMFKCAVAVFGLMGKFVAQTQKMSKSVWYHLPADSRRKNYGKKIFMTLILRVKL